MLTADDYQAIDNAMLDWKHTDALIEQYHRDPGKLTKNERRECRKLLLPLWRAVREITAATGPA